LKTAAAIDAATRLILFVGAILFYQHLMAVFVEHDSSKSWAVQLGKRAQDWYAKRREAQVPEVFKTIRLKRTVELPTEPPAPAK
jgi:hypothetical protein